MRRDLTGSIKYLVMGSACGCIVAVSGVTHGQAASDTASAATIDEITVTATRRDTAFLDVPLTVHVFTEEDFERQRIVQPADFLAQTANVNLMTAVRPGESNVSMRGIQGNFGLTQPVAIVVDGVVAANPNALDQELVGIEQIEVVKGPQSALYGRNANAGAIIINTLRPSQDPSLKVVAGAGNGGAYKAQAVLNGPLGSDRLSGRLALSHNEREGFWDNPTLGRPADIYQQQIADARVIYQISEPWTLDLRAKVSSLEIGSGLWDVQVAPFIPFDNNDYFPEFQMNNAPPARQVRQDFALKTDYQLSFATFTAIGSYDDYDSYYFADGAFHTAFPGGPPTIFVNPGAILNSSPALLPGYSYSIADGNNLSILNQYDKTIELRLTSRSELRLKWFLGSSYAESRRFVYSDTRQDTGAGILREILGATLDPAGANPLIQIGQYFVDRTENRAVFGQLQYDFTDSFSTDIALRYDSETRHNTNLIPDINSPVTGRPLTNPLVNPFGLEREADFSAVQPKLTLRYKPGAESTIFASVGRGFRSGGFNGAGTGAAVQLQAPTTNFPDAFPKEVSDAYELGFKARLADGRLSLDGALFYTEIEDAQSFTAFPSPPITIVISLEKVVARGFELGAAWRLSEYFKISNQFGYTDTEIRQTTVATALGKKIPMTPDYTNSLGLDFDTPFGPALTLQSRLEWQLVGPMWFDVYNSANTGRDSFSLVNARLALEAQRGSGSWQVSAWARNLLDKHYNVYSAPVPPIANFSYRAAPRMYGVDVTYKF